MAHPSIGVIDYSVGNIRSVMNALKEIGFEGTLIHDPDRVEDFEQIILPGVGAFASAMDTLNSSGLGDALRVHVDKGRKLIGICLGMQLLCESSLEEGEHAGFGWIPGQVGPFSPEHGLKIPHMGWNALHPSVEHPLFEGIEEGVDVYFIHSFHANPLHKAHVLAQCEYGDRFAAIIGRDNVLGMQFHPEKSQAAGLTMLKNALTIDAFSA
ncbi:imidazole glycerol phosphate synthase subunit HisH [Magnetococcus sp. PR-3]|uniref:imidazole glycerol phosphate synthase subunit HisH n=1 Tax=Magnetococcus sp. PR-3 TaxID=3120355 RepID=UPI002FCE4661